MTRMLRALLLLCAASLSILLTEGIHAQDSFPSRPIKMIVPFPAGGGIDVTARIAAQGLGNVLGQQIVIQNEGGAGGAIATDSVVKSDPDGYTLFITQRPASSMQR
jgi:tripartite-type tricarboxylate transporter receptor subunit TctC